MSRPFRSERHARLSMVAPPDTQPVQYAVRFPHCNGGPCDGGRKICPCPTECQTAIEDLPIQPSGRMALVLAVIVVALIAAIVFGGAR